MFDRKIKLPTTLLEYDQLVRKVVEKYKFTDYNHTSAIISVAIRHLPPDQAYSTVKYLGDYVSKNLANYIANHKSQTLQHEAQIDQLVNILTTDPNDNQARDALIKAKNEGSEYAAKAFDKLEPNAIAG